MVFFLLVCVLFSITKGAIQKYKCKTSLKPETTSICTLLKKHAILKLPSQTLTCVICASKYYGMLVSRRGKYTTVTWYDSTEDEEWTSVSGDCHGKVRVHNYPTAPLKDCNYIWRHPGAGCTLPGGWWEHMQRKLFTLKVADWYKLGRVVDLFSSGSLQTIESPAYLYAQICKNAQLFCTYCSPLSFI